MPTTVPRALARLEALGTEKVRARNRKRGAGDAQFGVLNGDVRKLAKEVKRDHALALELWATGIVEARLLAILVLEPNRLSAEELDAMVRGVDFVGVADWLDSYVVRPHPAKEALREAWMVDPDPWAARFGWSLTAERVGKWPQGLDLSALLDRIERELTGASGELASNRALPLPLGARPGARAGRRVRRGGRLPVRARPGAGRPRAEVGARAGADGRGRVGSADRTYRRATRLGRIGWRLAANVMTL